MDWLIYVILAFIYWKGLKFLALCYLTVNTAAICWCIVSELYSVGKDVNVGGEIYDI